MQVPAMVVEEKGKKKACMKYNRLYANPACETSTANTLTTDCAMCIRKTLHDDLTLSHRHRFFELRQPELKHLGVQLTLDKTKSVLPSPGV